MNNRSKILAAMSPRAALALLVWFATLAGACARTEKIVLRAAGHEIVAVIEGSRTVESLVSHAVVGSEFGKVTIEETRVRVDAMNWTQIPADAPVKISIRRGHLQVVAGTVKIGRTVRD